MNLMIWITVLVAGIFVSAEATSMSAPQFKTLTSPTLIGGAQFPGRFSLAFEWTDRSGAFLLVVSNKGDSTTYDGTEPDSIWVTCFRGNGGRQSKVWGMMDFSIQLESISFIKDWFRITDLDQDGIFEPSFLYVFYHDGLDPQPAKMMLYHNGKKYAIRGEFPMDGDWTTGYVKKPDPSLRKLPEIYRKFMHRRWDEFMTKEREKDEKSTLLK